LREMISTLRPGGWFVIDFLNPASVRRQLVPQETLELDGHTVRVTRSVSPDGRYVCKRIQAPAGRQYLERVRLFEPDQISDMVESSGVRIRQRFGDYDAAPFTAGSPRSILMGQVA
ncbi:MAG: class I SAM-dependent methyltransferase, partial [Gemmatimonadales bacterium]